MPDYVAFSTRVLFDLGWRRGYIREDQALPLRGSLFTKPRTATPLRRPLPANHVWMANISMPGHANMTMLVSYSYEKANTTRRRNVIRI